MLRPLATYAKTIIDRGINDWGAAYRTQALRRAFLSRSEYLINRAATFRLTTCGQQSLGGKLTI